MRRDGEMPPGEVLGAEVEPGANARGPHLRGGIMIPTVEPRHPGVPVRREIVRWPRVASHPRANLDIPMIEDLASLSSILELACVQVQAPRRAFGLPAQERDLSGAIVEDAGANPPLALDIYRVSRCCAQQQCQDCDQRLHRSSRLLQLPSRAPRTTEASVGTIREARRWLRGGRRGAASRRLLDHRIGDVR